GSVSGMTTLTVSSATITAFSVSWGTSGTASLQTASDGYRLLPAGRKVDLPWLGIDRIGITLNASATLTSGDVTVSSAAGVQYGPATITGSGMNYVIPLAQSIPKPDRVSIFISSPAIAAVRRRIDVLPGDVNDDGLVNTTDGLLILHNETPGHTYN